MSAGLLLAGLVLLVLGSGGETSFSLAGIATALFAGISYAAYTECGSMSLASGSSPTSTMAAMFFGGGLLSSPLLIRQDLTWLGNPSGLITIAYLSLVTLSLAYVWFGWGLKHLPPTSVVMLTMFEPVVAAVLAIAILDEELTLLAWAGIVVVLIGLAVVGRASRRLDTQPATVTP
jgi:DME family drug/metabolite transporter